jgi:exosortase
MLRNGWTQGHVIAAGVMTALAVWLGWDAWSDMFQIASRDEEASHIYLVPVVALWLVYVRRERIRHCWPRKQWIGPIIALSGAVLGTWGYYTQGQAPWHLGAVLVAVGAFLSVAGRDVLMRFMPAFLVLVFLVPVPGDLRQRVAIPLQSVTALVTQATAELFGMGIVRRGSLLTINGVDVAIAEACNGLRMVFALVLVSYAFAFGTPLRPYVRVLILIGSPLSAIACNVVRLIPTVYIYGHMPNEFALQFHNVSGWAMLPIAFLVLMGLVRLLRWALVPIKQYTLAYDS